VLGRCASSAALTVGQMAARTVPAAPGVTGRGGRLLHREGGVASTTAAGDELGVAVGDDAAGTAAGWLAGGCATVAEEAHPDAASTTATAMPVMMPALATRRRGNDCPSCNAGPTSPCSGFPIQRPWEAVQIVRRAGGPSVQRRSCSAAARGIQDGQAGGGSTPARRLLLIGHVF
jgi:hypothetical protein